MARGLFSVKSTGLKEFANELEKLSDDFHWIIYESLAAQEDVMMRAVQNNWTSLVGGTPGGYVYDSVGKSVAYSQSSKNVVVGTVGVYHMDSVASKHEITAKDLNAAQIAYWVEFGTSRLRSGKRKVPGVEYSDEDLIDVRPIPFISNAFYSTINEQEKAFAETFNKLADTLR